jgi:hypothetical protein
MEQMQRQRELIPTYAVTATPSPELCRNDASTWNNCSVFYLKIPKMEGFLNRIIPLLVYNGFLNDPPSLAYV